MRKTILVLVLALSLSACSSGKDLSVKLPEAVASESVSPSPSASPSPSPTPAPTPEPSPEYLNPLTGLEIDEQYINRRPIAVMFNNIKQALPQYGVSKADIIYEALAEGGITRMIGVFQNISGAGNLGSIRSTRAYYLDVAQGLDAILVHAGGSPEAYSLISSRGVTNLDGIYIGSILFWRDSNRIKTAGYEHSLFTSGTLIESYLAASSYRTDHKDGYKYDMTFKDDGTPSGGTAAQTVTVKFSDYKTGTFEYDSTAKLYNVSQYGAKYTDGADGTQIAVTNVLVIKAAISTYDSKGRLSTDLVGSGEGMYICGGKAIDITWSKASYDSQFVYKLKDGSVLEPGRGKSYVNIIPAGNSVTIK